MSEIFSDSSTTVMATPTDHATTDANEVLPWVLTIHIILLFTSTVLIILSNVIVLLVFHFNKSLRDVTGIFIQSLACADLGVGIGCIFSIHSWFEEEWPYGERFCTFTGFTLSAVLIVSILNLLMLSIDRYIAVTRPLTYYSIMTRKKCYMCVAFVWVFSFTAFLPTLSGMGNYWYNYYTFECAFEWERNSIFSTLLVGLVVLPAFSVSGFCYYHILKTCWAHKKQIHQVKSYFSGQESNESSRVRHEGNLAKMFLVVVSGFYITWFPLLTVKILKGFVNINIPPSVYFFSTWLGEFNSFINCIVYSIGHKSFREYFHKMVSAGWTEVAKKFWNRDQRRQDQKKRKRPSISPMMANESRV
ncbi:G-protein coupled receptor 52 [Holothuria leucospilota]|uniref:G-protein coupled receptor 52 n=1 Tax=Holothuria leucospilota TaxID=206669 RepID=A0A9Q1HAQ7_HOLLE|nr:G-protein coupled receptor 52 [Holothuria leucospilota]